jgi:hypothetical protein
MIIRVPLLLQRSVAVIHRLDISSTRAANPPGEANVGYDETLREPIVYDGSTTTPDTRQDTRKELSEIRVPCQVEVLSDEALRELGVGDAPITNMTFVFHRETLENLGLLDSNRDVTLKKGDRVSHLEKYGAAVGTVIKTFSDPGLYIYEMRAGSWGFGPDGYDLEIALTSKRQEAVGR